MKAETTHSYRPLGQILLERHLVDDAQLQAALRYKEEHGIKLGQALTQLQMVSQADLSDAMREQGKLPCIHLSLGLIDQEIARGLGEETSRGLVAIAIQRIAGVTSIAMSDPGDVYAVDAIAMRLGTTVFPIYAEPGRIEACLDSLFAREEDGQGARGALSAATLLAHSTPSPSLETDVARVEELFCSLLSGARTNSQKRLWFEPHGDCIRVRAREGTRWVHSVDLREPWGSRVAEFLREVVPVPAGQQVNRLDLVLEGVPVEAWSWNGAAGPEWQFAIPPCVSEPDDSIPDGALRRIDSWATLGGVTLWAQPAADEDSGLLGLGARWTAEGHKVVYIGTGPRCSDRGLMHWIPDATEGLEGFLRALIRLRPERVVIDLAGPLPGTELVAALVRGGTSIVLRVEHARAEQALAGVQEDSCLSQVVRGVVARRSAPLLCMECRRPLAPDEGEGFCATGCLSCMERGTVGERHVVELLVPSLNGAKGEDCYEWRFDRELQELFAQGNISAYTLRELVDRADQA